MEFKEFARALSQRGCIWDEMRRTGGSALIQSMNTSVVVPLTVAGLVQAESFCDELLVAHGKVTIH